jgi:hypothetical protein
MCRGSSAPPALIDVAALTGGRLDTGERQAATELAAL